MKANRALLTLLVLSGLVIAGYWGWRYFFDPRGINIADGEICATNETKLELVFSVETIPGAKVIALVDPHGRICAPSPVAKPKGVVMTGESEASLGCRYELSQPDRLPFLTAYRSPNDCDWGHVSR